MDNYGKNDYYSYYNLLGKRLFNDYSDLHANSQKNITAFWESNFVLTGYPNGKGVLFVNNKCQIENEQGILEETVCAEKEELLRLLLKFYPGLKTPEVFMYIDRFWRSKYDSKL